MRPSTTPDLHRNKRQFQSSITSFFAYEDRDGDEWEERGPGPITRAHQHSASGRAHHYQHQQLRGERGDSLVPNLPGSVQADLLSVGMRVRKSVPEGYKTHKTAAALPSIQTTLSNNKSPIVTVTEYSVRAPRDPVPDSVQHQRELLPFCGLHKIGGYAEQPVTNVHLYGGTDATGERAVNLFPLPAEAFSQPFSSQSSTDSSVSSDSLRPNPTNPYKRGWQDEEEAPLHLNSNFLFKIPLKGSDDEVPVSPLSETPTQSINALPRPFAQPKSRRQGGRLVDIDGAMLKETDMDVDLENVEQIPGRVLVGSSSDFGEAEFLVKPWQAGREVDMGGV